MCIRPARKNDVPAIHDCHDLAILAKAADDYAPEIVQAWLSNRNPELIAKDEALIDDPDMIFLVYERDDVIYGFAMANPAQQALGAVYVAEGAGALVGALLMEEVKALSRRRGCTYLEFDSSLGARNFYERQGAVVLGETTHRMRAGFDMPCVKMRLTL